ncbi:hypothetical protein SELMODRAFT_447529 [Selaginella moellendorffii]|uniref:Uncharacterized protein n=1 Tax=Selaginella moellendorffii TaxID=88036 RepID=D8T085_SELML|nr:hypothetical protein SELMODRAFT_447529 [Selaginella moellendorffii]
MNVGLARAPLPSGFLRARQDASSAPLALRLGAQSRRVNLRSGISRFRSSRLVARAGEDGDSDKDEEEGEESEEQEEEAKSPARTGETRKNRSGFFASFWKSNKQDEPPGEEQVEEEVKKEEEGYQGFWGSLTGSIDREADAPGLEDLEIKWGELLEPSVDNALALVLTGLLGLAVLQISWQLLLVTAAIIVSGLKYTVLAGFLIAFVIFFL